MGIENEARVTGDRVCEMFTREPKHCAFARLRGLGPGVTVDLGLTPQALCSRPLARAHQRSI